MILKPQKTKRANQIEEEMRSVSSNEYCYINNSPVIQNVFHVHLTKEVAEAKEYRELFHLLRTANEHDNFIFYLNDYGGYLHTAIELINAIKASHADQVVCVVSGPIYSAAPLIALSCKRVHVEDNSFFMFHDYSGGEIGKGNEIERSVKNFQPFWKKFFSETCRGFLSDKEIQDILNGQDLYVNKNQAVKRLKKIKKLKDS